MNNSIAGSAGAPKGLQSAATLQGAAGVWNRVHILADFGNHLQNADCGPPGADASPPTFHSVSTRPFASIHRFLRRIEPRRCSKLEFWTPPSLDHRYIMHILLSEPPTSTDRPHDAAGAAKIGRPTSSRRLLGGGGDSPQASSNTNITIAFS